MKGLESFTCSRGFRASVSSVAIAALLVSIALAGRADPRSHLDWARILVREVRPENTSYRHKQGFVKWKGEGGALAYESHTDCSGFLTALLEHAYGFDQNHFVEWLGTRRPLAIDYHDAILKQRKFRQIQQLNSVRPGDILAIRYPPDAENSGHVMLVAETPRLVTSTRPEIPGTEQWEVEVID